MVTKKAKEASMVKFLGSDSTRLGGVCPSQQGDCASTCDAQHKTIESQSKQQCFDSDSILTLQACGFTQDTWTFLSDLHPVSARKSSIAFLSFDKGRTSLLTRSMRPVRAVDYLATLDPSQNVYVTVHRFHGKRCNENLSELTALQLDLDFYDKNSLWAARVEDDPQALVESFHALCRDLDLPVPSLITYSHGLQMLWLLERPVPTEALVRWRLIEKVLVNHFKDYGADGHAVDPARVFRLPGTVNSKNGRLCRIVSRVTDETGAVQRYNFEYMSECLLAVGRWECEKHRAPAIVRGRGRTAVRRGTVPAVRSKFFYQHAFDDIVKLIDLRGGIAEGGRMTTLYLMAVAACHAGVVTPETLEAEAFRWAKAIDPTWKVQMSALSTVKDRFVRTLAGELIDFQGKKVSPLYTPSRRTLIDALDITIEEQKQLKTLCFADLSCQDRKNARRRKDAALDLAAIQKAHQEKLTGVKQLRADGKSASEIALALGIAVGTVYKYLKEVPQAPTKSRQQQVSQHDYAERVDEARALRRKGFSVQEIAGRMHVTNRTIQRYLQGMPVPSEGVVLPPLPEGERAGKLPDTALFCGGASRRDCRKARFNRDVKAQRVAPLSPSLRDGGSLAAEEVGNSGGGGVGTARRLADAVGSALPQGGAEGGKRGLGLGKRRFSETRLQEIREIPLEEAVVRIGGSVTVDRTFKPRKDPSTRRFEAQFEGHTWEVVATGMKFVARSKADAATVKTSAEGGGAIDLAKVITGHEFISVVTFLSNYITALT